jgi:hypothetical protein
MAELDRLLAPETIVVSDVSYSSIWHTPTCTPAGRASASSRRAASPAWAGACR